MREMLGAFSPREITAQGDRRVVRLFVYREFFFLVAFSLYSGVVLDRRRRPNAGDFLLSFSRLILNPRRSQR